MKRFDEGDRVRIDIPDKSDPDYDRLHDEIGTVIEVFEDDAAKETGDPRDGNLFRVRIQNGDTVDLRWRDLRPAPDTN